MAGIIGNSTVQLIDGKFVSVDYSLMVTRRGKGTYVSDKVGKCSNLL